MELIFIPVQKLRKRGLHESRTSRGEKVEVKEWQKKRELYQAGCIMALGNRGPSVTLNADKASHCPQQAHFRGLEGWTSHEYFCYSSNPDTHGQMQKQLMCTLLESGGIFFNIPKAIKSNFFPPKVKCLWKCHSNEKQQPKCCRELEGAHSSALHCIRLEWLIPKVFLL